MKKPAVFEKVHPAIFVVVLLLIVVAVANAIRIGIRDDKKTGAVPAASSDVEYPLTVCFVDVGQGDGIVIRCKDTALVIDGGEREAADAMVKALQDLGVDSVDCYIATHPHSDHIGAAAAIFAAVNVKSVITTAFSEINMPTTKSFERFQNAIDAQGCEVIFAEAGEKYRFGSMELEVFAPVEETVDYNNMSIVFRLTYGKNTFMFTGDAQTESEELILNKGYDLHADVLKLGHHGSSDATCEAFFRAVDPQFAVISCGKNNDYGHPHREILRMLEDAGVDYRRTDISGTVTVYGDGKNIFIKE